MKHSGMFLCFVIIITTFCFFTKYTCLCSSTLFCVSSPTNHQHRQAWRRALSTHLTQHESGAVKVLDATKHLPDQDRREEPLKNGINGADGEDESVYHIDYHGVTTHPGPNPKHGKP